MSTQVYRHDLTGKLEAALRSSNAQVPTYRESPPLLLTQPNTVVPYGDACAVVVVVQFEQADILNRVGVRLLEPSAGEDGWDVRACGAGRGCSQTSGAEHQLLWCGRLLPAPRCSLWTTRWRRPCQPSSTRRPRTPTAGSSTCSGGSSALSGAWPPRGSEGGRRHEEGRAVPPSH